MSMRQPNVMRWRVVPMCVGMAALALCRPICARAEVRNPNTDWFKNAGCGVFMHFLPGDAQGLARVEDFDVDALADQVAVEVRLLYITAVRALIKMSTVMATSVSVKVKALNGTSTCPRG